MRRNRNQSRNIKTVLSNVKRNAMGETVDGFLPPCMKLTQCEAL